MTTIPAAAAALVRAFATRTTVPALTHSWPTMTLADAYGVQRRLVDTWVQAGDPVRGHKVGLVSEAVRKQMQVHEPDFGHLTASMFRTPSEPLRTDDFIQPRVEPEVAVILKRDLRGPGVTTASAARAVDAALPALEIVDSRITNWDLTIADTIADNASSGAVVLGDSALPIDALDLEQMVCTLSRNGEVAEQACGAAVYGSPIRALAWLANTVGMLGVGLEAGHIVLTGSFTRMIPMQPGDTIAADFVGLGNVELAVATESGERP